MRKRLNRKLTCDHYYFWRFPHISWRHISLRNTRYTVKQGFHKYRYARWGEFLTSRLSTPCENCWCSEGEVLPSSSFRHCQLFFQTDVSAFAVCDDSEQSARCHILGLKLGYICLPLHFNSNKVELHVNLLYFYKV
jgi:hypothetical protein